MSYMDVMYGGLGQATNFNQNNLAQNAAMNQQNQAAIQAQQAAAAAQQAQLNNLYGPQGFGGQTAAYAGAGAAAGRNTGYYGDTGASDPGALQPPTPAQPSSPEEAAYFAAYPDVAASGMSAAQHYQLYGQNEGRNSFGMVFNTGANPYNDYGLGNTFSATGNVGQSPGMAPGYGGFDNPAVPTSPQQWYANGGYDPYNPATYAPAATPGGGMPQMLGTGSGGYDPQWGGSSIYSKGAQAVPSDWNNWFGQFQSTTGGGPNDYTHGGGWEREYLLGNQDVLDAAKASGSDPIAFADQHFRDFGQKEGRGVFDAAAYLRDNPDVAAAGVNPFQHYNQYGKAEGREAPMSGAFDPMMYKLLNADVDAAGIDPTAHWLEFGKNEGRVGGFAPSNEALGRGANYDFSNPLVSQRADYAAKVRDDPSLSLKLAARLYSEDQNDPGTRQAILEAMLNRYKATGQDPLNLKYYPPDPTAYNNALSKLSGNNDLLNQIYREMEQPFGGSNTSNYATDWASGTVAGNEAQFATPTWTSPSNEQFFRKDINNDWTGAGIAAQNKAWFDSLTSPPR